MTQKILTRNFLLICFAQFTFSIIFFALIPTIPIYLSRLGIKEAEIGILVGVLSVTSLVVRPFIGRSLLRVPERRFLIAGSLVVALCSIAYLFARPFFPFLLVRALHGIGFAFFATAGFTFAVNVAPAAHRGQSISYYYLAINVATALGPAFGMLLISRFSFPILFLACAALSFCSLLVTLKLGKVQGVPGDSIVTPKDQPLLSREALPPSIMAFISNNLWGGVAAFFPLFALSHGVDNPGVFFAAFASVLILGRGFGGKLLDVHREKVIVPCLITQMVAMLTLAFSTTLPMFILAAVIWGMGGAFLYPLLLVTAVDRAGPLHGPALGTYTAMVELGAGMGSVLMGIVVQLTGYRMMFLCLALTCVINLFYFNLFVKRKE